MNKSNLTAPCGLDCFNCPYYQDNITEEIQRNVAVRTGLVEDEVPCKGCLEQKGHCPWFSSCATYDCIMGKGLRFCFECNEFPCLKLQPAADGAEQFPHNMKVYNLCRIKLIGVDKWAEEESFQIRKRYFKGKFKVGLGPVLE
jgi:hypothetical protein